mmetsp:Transcript_2450/g.2883  ORF Transcript_2450/g.2883 Transcript_2450/m.2883 type:complete len:121 (+) Transcript_2450:86-448(+)
MFQQVNLVKQLISAVTDNQRLEDAIKEFAETNESIMGRKRRHRRPAHEIRRHYRCPASECKKAYGSEGSLSQHLKLKHRPYFEQYSKEASENTLLWEKQMREKHREPKQILPPLNIQVNK